MMANNAMKTIPSQCLSFFQNLALASKQDADGNLAENG